MAVRYVEGEYKWKRQYAKYSGFFLLIYNVLTGEKKSYVVMSQKLLFKHFYEWVVQKRKERDMSKYS